MANGDMRPACRNLIARLRLHCAQIGIKPPAVALRRYASLRWLESQWYVRHRITRDRAEDAELLAYRLRLDKLERGTPLCGPDLADVVRPDVPDDVLAPWPDGPLMVGMRDLT